MEWWKSELEEGDSSAAPLFIKASAAHPLPLTWLVFYFINEALGGWNGGKVN